MKSQNGIEISVVLKDLRKRAGFSQQALAAHLRVSLPTVNRWEKEKTTPDRRAVQAIRDLANRLGHKDLAERLAVAVPEPPAPPHGEARPARRGRRPKAAAASETAAAEGANGMDTKSMETMLWKAACSIRGEKDAPKFKDYILPLVFIKRLSDVFEDEIVRLVEDFGDEKTAREMIETDRTLVRFYIPPEAMWAVVSGRRAFEWPASKRPKTLGEQLTETVRAIVRANSSLQGVIDIVDYNETRNGEREVSDEALRGIIETLSDPRYRLGLKDVEPDFLGRAYEYLLRKFAEGQGQSAGEFFTPREVGVLIARIMEPHQGEEVYDPCCGSGGLLVKCQIVLREREKKVGRPLQLHGQELTGSSFAIARMNMVLHDMEGEIARGNTMLNPKFLDRSRLKRFDIVVTNPMWNQDNFDSDFFDKDPFERFAARGGYAPGSSADWAWLQHVHASLNDAGRAGVVLDTGAASRGSGSQGENKEKTIRRWFVEEDQIEGVVLLPENLFYNTTAAGIVVVLNRKKPKDRRGKIVLINASAEFKKGRPKNYLPDEGIGRIATAFREGKDVDRLARVVPLEEIAKNDFNLSPSRYVETAVAQEHRDIQEILDDLGRLTAEERVIEKDLAGIFGGMGYRYSPEGKVS